MSDVVEQMAEHFAPPDLRERVAAVLERAGKNASNTTVEELAGLDQWHVEGLVPTRRLAELAGVSGSDAVLDAGCGMGGPARYLAQTYGCTVRGIDMTAPYLETDKAAFFAELFRVLKPGGRAVVHDLYRGPGSPVHFPAFWGQDDSISFLISDAQMRELLEGAGFEVVHWNDTTESAHGANDAIDAEHAKTELEAETIDGLDIFLLFGEQTLVMADNSVKDMQVGSVGIFEAVLRRP
jgi:SAM-dependent methyltransferase